MKTEASLGWIGLGKMGRPLAERLIRNGHSLTVHDRDAGRMKQLAGSVVRTVGSPAEVAEKSDIIFIMVTDDNALEAVVAGLKGVLNKTSGQTLLVDMGTHSPHVSARMSRQLEGAGAAFLRAPVSGTVMHAAAGTLLLFASGPKDGYERCRRYFSLFADKCYYIGGNEEARYFKLLHNAMLGVTGLMLAEALTFGEKAGLDLSLMMDVLNESVVASPVMAYKSEAIKNRTFDLTFPAVHMIKDLDLALNAARPLAASMPLAALTRQFFETMKADGQGEEDFFAILKLMEKIAGFRPQDPASGSNPENRI